VIIYSPTFGLDPSLDQKIANGFGETIPQPTIEEDMLFLLF